MQKINILKTKMVYSVVIIEVVKCRWLQTGLADFQKKHLPRADFYALFFNIAFFDIGSTC